MLSRVRLPAARTRFVFDSRYWRGRTVSSSGLFGNTIIREMQGFLRSRWSVEMTECLKSCRHALDDTPNPVLLYDLSIRSGDRMRRCRSLYNPPVAGVDERRSRAAVREIVLYLRKGILNLCGLCPCRRT